mgnify:CR=1 FL=1
MGHVDGGRLLKPWQRRERIVSRIAGSRSFPVLDRSWHKTKTNFESSVQSVSKPSSRLTASRTMIVRRVTPQRAAS